MHSTFLRCLLILLFLSSFRVDAQVIYGDSVSPERISVRGKHSI